ncbi:MAG: Uncharacterised protein [Synechococcus sp. CC9902]|nr:MAG: Uncharacterised protein [Synechococcus sp. CC9902]
MLHRHILLKTSTADTHKSHAIPMPRIHVGLQFEHESTESLAQRINKSFTA